MAMLNRVIYKREKDATEPLKYLFNTYKIYMARIVHTLAYLQMHTTNVHLPPWAK